MKPDKNAKTEVPKVGEGSTEGATDSVAKTEESVADADEKRLTEKERLHLRLVGCIDEFGGESRIPITHEYWMLNNQYRSMK